MAYSYTLGDFSLKIIKCQHHPFDLLAGPEMVAELTRTYYVMSDLRSASDGRGVASKLIFLLIGRLSLSEARNI